MIAVVIKEHISNYPRPIKFKSAEHFEVGIEDPEYPGWIWVITREGNEGWAPLEYIEILPGTRGGIAKYDYCARELDVELGERLQIDDRHCGWLKASNSRGKSGWIPQACVEFA
ncbi:MAG: ligand-binding protein SH3 [Gammaproteobacteria bacterium]|nr:ligand-binding protein SH3 [Gammaproteobacteria bacterium]